MNTSSQRELLRIAIVSDAIFPYNKGGKEKRVFELSTRLVKKGHTVTVYCMKWWKGHEQQRIENGVVLKAICKHYPLYDGKRRSIRQAVFFAIACFKLIKEDFDILDVDHMPHLILFPLKIVSVVKRKKFIVTWNEVWGRSYWVAYMGFLGNIAFLVEWITARLPDVIITVSEETTEKLTSVLRVHKPIITIPMGIDLDLIKQTPPAPQSSDIIFAGRMLAHKNVALLVQAIALLKKIYPNVRAYIIGEGPEKNHIQTLISKLSLQKNITLLHFFESHKQLYAMMKASNVFVFPSTREGFGIVALEALACNIPVITTNYKDNGARRLIDPDKNGFLVQLSAEEIGDAIKKILKQHKKYNFQHYVKDYSWEFVTEKTIRVYRS